MTDFNNDIPLEMTRAGIWRRAESQNILQKCHQFPRVSAKEPSGGICEDAIKMVDEELFEMMNVVVCRRVNGEKLVSFKWRGQ